MRKIYLALFVMLFCPCISPDAYSQDELPVDTAVFFTHLKFGSNIPKQLAACAGYTADTHNPYPNSLAVFSDSLTVECGAGYADLFTFLSIPFSHTIIITNKSGQILSVSLRIFFIKEKDSAKATVMPLVLYNQIAEQMGKRYGKPSRTDTGNGIDTALLRAWGREIPLLAAWNGIYKSVTLHAQYGSSYNLDNWLTVDIRDQKFADPSKQVELAD